MSIGVKDLARSREFLTTVPVNAETPRFRASLEPFILLLAALSLDRLSSRRIPRPRPVAAHR